MPTDPQTPPPAPAAPEAPASAPQMPSAAANSLQAQRATRMFVGGGYVTLLVAFLAVVVVPYLRATGAAQADIARCKQEISEREARSSQLDELKQRVQLIDLQTRNFSRLVPENQDFGQFSSDLTTVLDKAGMRDPSKSAMPPTALGKSIRRPIEVQCKGTFAQFHDFLVGLEGLNRMSSVGKLSIDADNEMTGTVTATVTLYIYYTKSGS